MNDLGFTAAFFSVFSILSMQESRIARLEKNPSWARAAFLIGIGFLILAVVFLVFGFVSQVRS